MVFIIILYKFEWCFASISAWTITVYTLQFSVHKLTASFDFGKSGPYFMEKILNDFCLWLNAHCINGFSWWRDSISHNLNINTHEVTCSCELAGSAVQLTLSCFVISERSNTHWDYFEYRNIRLFAFTICICTKKKKITIMKLKLCLIIM